jgi:hypothetical protein
MLGKRKSVVALQLASRMCVSLRHFGRPDYDALEEIPMDKNPDKTGGNKSHFTSPESVIKDVIQSIETVDRKIKEFYAIYGTDLQMTRDNPPILGEGVESQLRFLRQ